MLVATQPHTYPAAKAKKRSAEQRSNSTKVTALSMLKGGVPPIQVSRQLKIPTRTLRSWRQAAMAAGTWNLEAAGDAKARPAPRKNNLWSSS